MAVDNVQLPARIERGARGGPRFQETIQTAFTGREQRNRDWAIARREYDIGYGVQRKSEFQEVQAFFLAQGGRHRPFLFKDWSDFSVTAQAIGTGDGADTTFDLVKTYANAVNTDTRGIDYPVAGFTVFLNGTPTVAFTRSLRTLTFSAAPGLGVAITWTGDFLVPVRFNIDHLAIELEWEQVGHVRGIQIVEIFGE